MKVDSAGRSVEPSLCVGCHEKLCAREWRADVWTRQMR